MLIVKQREFWYNSSMIEAEIVDWIEKNNLAAAPHKGIVRVK